MAVASTAMLCALPGQIIFVEMHTLAAPLVATVLAVMLSSARFLPMTLVLMASAALSTAAGHLGADRLPPLYIGTMNTSPSLACGAIAGPLAYLATPEWSVPLAGLAGGTVAYLILKKT